jgi:prepilin-type N-terminal cleavage/methylation domain-containing protein
MHNNKKIKQQGFTLIELMIVVSIIGILTAIAIPSYQYFTVRAKLIEVLRFSDAAKTYIWEEYATNAHMPEADTTSASNITDMMLSSEYISSAVYTKIDIDIASIEVKFKNMGAGADDKTMIFLLDTDKETIRMACNQGTLEDFYRPSVCRVSP